MGQLVTNILSEMYKNYDLGNLTQLVINTETIDPSWIRSRNVVGLFGCRFSFIHLLLVVLLLSDSVRLHESTPCGGCLPLIVQGEI